MDSGDVPDVPPESLPALLSHILILNSLEIKLNTSSILKLMIERVLPVILFITVEKIKAVGLWFVGFHYVAVIKKSISSPHL